MSSSSGAVSPGASGVSLRGLGQKNTLVLINGRRVQGTDQQAPVPVMRALAMKAPGAADESLPVVLETSNDGVAFVVVSTRREPYSQRAPWIVRAPMHSRYLRVRMPGMGYVALSEIEAYQR